MTSQLNNDDKNALIRARNELANSNFDKSLVFAFQGDHAATFLLGDMNITDVMMAVFQLCKQASDNGAPNNMPDLNVKQQFLLTAIAGADLSEKKSIKPSPFIKKWIMKVNLN